MAYDGRLAARIRDQLVGKAGATERRVFGRSRSSWTT
jgi:hypothetical protein